MKIPLDVGDELEVPESLIQRAKYEYGDVDDDLVHEISYEFLSESNGKLIGKELAEYLSGFVTGRLPFGGGYPIDYRTDIDIGGNKIRIYVCGWNSGSKDDSLNIFISGVD